MSINNLDRFKVEQFSYRTATVGNRFLQLPRTLLKDLEEALAKRAGKQIDNHTAYKLEGDEFRVKETIYISFSDDNAAFGRSIEMRSW